MTRTGNLRSLSTRDWAAIRERREFEKQEADRQRLAEDRVEYDKYVQIVEEDQRRVPPAYRIGCLDFDTWRSYAPQQENDPVLRGTQATNAALLSRVRKHEAAELEGERNKSREAVLAGKPDPNWKIPASAAGLRMSVEKAKAYAREQSSLFVEHNPEYFPSRANVDAITEYLIAQDVSIPNEECFRLAWLRLRDLGMIEERPVPTPEPTPAPVQQPTEAVPAETELVDGFDLETGEPRKFTQREIWKMDSTTFRKAFRAWGDNRPKFTWGYFGPR